MSTIINGSSPSITFSDGTTQTTAFSASSVVTSVTAGTGISVSASTGGVTITNTSSVNASQLARAWVNYNASTQTVTSSFNVSSVTYNSTGNYTINFTSALNNANYAAVFGAQDTVTGAEFLAGVSGGTKTTSAYQVNNWNYVGTRINSSGVYVAFFSS